MYREQWADDILNGRSLLECALDVHMATTGSSERSPESQRADIRVLHNALLTWMEGAPQLQKFDNAVKTLIQVAIEESEEDYVVPVKDVIKCIEDEPELPGDMPDDLWKQLQGSSRSEIQSLMRNLVHLTKAGIKERVLSKAGEASNDSTP